MNELFVDDMADMDLLVFMADLVWLATQRSALSARFSVKCKMMMKQIVTN
jgi:hypothetical protein